MKRPATFTLDEELIKRLRELSKETKIAQARYVSEAIEWILKKEGK